jgi:colanic acid biosynthesis glycosyl transferase WcaI
MRDILIAKGVATNKCGIVPNWIKIDPASQEVGGFFGEFPAGNGRFRVSYAGNLGIKQGVDSLLKLAKALEGNERFWFFVFGDGADRARLLGIAEELKLTNLTFGPLLDPSAYGRMLAEVDLVFVAQRSGAGNNFFPSKLLGLMAQAKPLLVSADPDSELSQSVRKWQCAAVAAFDDTDSLARKLSELAADELSLRLLGSNGAEAVMSFERGKVLADWRERIRRIAQRE